jgi:hypothetical protein
MNTPRIPTPSEVARAFALAEAMVALEATLLPDQVRLMRATIKASLVRQGVSE